MSIWYQVFPSYREDLRGHHMSAGRRLRHAAIVVGFSATILGAWIYRAPILSGVARLWIISDSPAVADAIVVLGGGLETRPDAAARLYHEGWARQILVMEPERSLTAQGGVMKDEASIVCKLLEREDVPDGSIALVEPTVTSTFDEAVALTDWAKKHNARRLLVPTDPFHTRRAKWIFNRMMKEAGVDVRLIPITSRHSTVSNWWHTEHGSLEFQSELFKYAWYLSRY